jgi:hypothetical protein
MSMITEGTTVRFYEPSVEEILAAWSGERRTGAGQVLSATVAKVVIDDTGTRYITTTDGLVLTDADLRGVA